MTLDQEVKIVELQYKASDRFRRLFDRTMVLIQGGVGPEYTEDKAFLRKRMLAQRLLETSPRRMTQEQRELMNVPSGDVINSTYRHATYVAIDSNGRPVAAVYGSLLDVKGEPMMFMGYAARARGVSTEVIDTLVGGLKGHLNTKSFEIHRKPIKYVAIEIERGNKNDIPLAKKAMQHGAYPLKVKEDNKGFGYTQPGIDAEKHARARYSPQRLQLLFGSEPHVTRQEARKVNFDHELIARVFDAIFAQEYLEFSGPGPQLAREQSFALQKSLQSIEGMDRVGYDFSRKGVGWIYRRK